MRLGQEVLCKIQNLLTRFQESPKSISKNKVKQGSTRRSTFQKLYEDHKKHLKRLDQNNKNRMVDEIKQNSPFKITNKHTIFLNSQKENIPIHKRLNRIKTDKQEQLAKLHSKYSPAPQFETELDNSCSLEKIESRSVKQRKFTPQQAKQQLSSLMEKERLRLERLNMLKLRSMEEHSKHYRRRPYVGKDSQQVWNRYKLKKQLSSSVFQRFQQYQMDRKYRQQKVERKVRNSVTPFAPKISQQSRLLASKSSSRANLRQELSRSCSCKCFHKQRTIKLDNSTALHSSRKS